MLLFSNLNIINQQINYSENETKIHENKTKNSHLSIGQSLLANIFDFSMDHLDMVQLLFDHRDEKPGI